MSNKLTTTLASAITAAGLCLGVAAQAGPVTYWSMFNAEGSSSATNRFSTYATLTDMLNGTNSTGTFDPSSGGSSGQNVVGSGAEIIRPVPEPGTLAIFGLGLAGLGFARRRKAA